MAGNAQGDGPRFAHDEVRPDYPGDTKRDRVERMFDAIAPAYDRLNQLLSLGIDRRWRNTLVDRVLASHPQRVLDVATGTADLALSLARRGVDVLGIDISERMLVEGRRKVAAAGLEARVRLERGDALHLDVPDGAFDAVVAAFGVRNFEDLDRGVRELVRALRPGGLLAVLELSEPSSPLLRAAHRVYTSMLLPHVGQALSGQRAAYTYLPASVQAFPSGRRFAEVCERSGAREMEARPLTFGIATLYLGTR